MHLMYRKARLLGILRSAKRRWTDWSWAGSVIPIPIQTSVLQIPKKAECRYLKYQTVGISDLG